jgi:hypothetical protein
MQRDWRTKDDEQQMCKELERPANVQRDWRTLIITKIRGKDIW